MSSTSSPEDPAPAVVFLNPATCGIYKNGGPRYKTDPRTGARTCEIDNEMADHVGAYLATGTAPGMAAVPLPDVFRKGIVVPRYYDARWLDAFQRLCAEQAWEGVSLGELADHGVIQIQGGHGSPSNDQRTGHIPYVKVSDIRSLRVNVNPTNLVSEVVARSFWGGWTSGLEAWDLITPNRASSNIGEFAILLPGEEQVVLTKEVFVVRVTGGAGDAWSPFYLLWALSLRAVRRQWQRVALMQTNREDVGRRWREILIPRPLDRGWAENVSGAFKTYFTTLAEARIAFRSQVDRSGLDFIASVFSIAPEPVEPETDAEDAQEMPAATEDRPARRRVRRTVDADADGAEAAGDRSVPPVPAVRARGRRPRPTAE